MATILLHEVVAFCWSKSGEAEKFPRASPAFRFPFSICFSFFFPFSACSTVKSMAAWRGFSSGRHYVEHPFSFRHYLSIPCPPLLLFLLKHSSQPGCGRHPSTSYRASFLFCHGFHFFSYFFEFWPLPLSCHLRENHPLLRHC